MNNNINTKKTFHPIINTLRALAVTVVVGYHAGIEFLPGGYVGVDVFFVISGFLIINHILNEYKNEKFSFSAFYARRAIRILPPYFVVILTCLIVAPFILVLPTEIKSFQQEVAWSAGMAANFLFLSQQGYFDASSNTKILLHLWSLAVEEQFYLLAPLCIISVLTLSRGTNTLKKNIVSTVSIGVVFFASLILCILFTDPSKNYSFYMMPLRAWEFIAGGLVAVTIPLMRKTSPLANNLLLTAGLSLITISVVFYDHSTPFPSYWALFPVMGTCLVIGAGIAHPNGLSKILSPSPILWIGLVSYSWYLWHWPILIFTRIYFFQEVSLARDILVSIIALGFAFLTYFFVEQPTLRLRKIAPTISMSWWPTIIGIGTSICLIGYVAPNAFSNQTNVNPIAETVAHPFPACAINRKTVNAECDLIHKGQSAGIILGDSHARALSPALRSVTSDIGSLIVSSFNTACPPIFNVRRQETSKTTTDCVNGLKITGNFLQNNPGNLEYAIISARWPAYYGEKRHRLISLTEGKVTDYSKFLIDNLKNTISELKKSGIKRILIIGNLPHFPRSVPECLARANHYNSNIDSYCSISRASHEKINTGILSWLNTSIEDQEAVKVFDPTDIFCDENFCRPHANKTALFYDDNHVNFLGASLLLSSMTSDLDWLLGLNTLN